MNESYRIPVSVKGVVFEGDSVWLRKNERNEWELPGGKIDSEELPEAAVVRELKEELGFNVEVVDIIQSHLLKIPNSLDEAKGVLILTFSCKLLSKSGGFELQGEAGTAEFRKFTLKELGSINSQQFYKEAIVKAHSDD